MVIYDLKGEADAAQMQVVWLNRLSRLSISCHLEQHCSYSADLGLLLILKLSEFQSYLNNFIKSFKLIYFFLC